jgi:hypothetical protein
MENCIQIIAVECDGDDGVIVKFSDGTITGYVPEELLELRPFREPITETCATQVN